LPFPVVSTKLEAPDHQPDPRILLRNGPDKFRNLKSDRRKEVISLKNPVIKKPLNFFSIAYRMFAFRNIIFPREVSSCNER
jgi:hypothetical protein